MPDPSRAHRGPAAFRRAALLSSCAALLLPAAVRAQDGAARDEQMTKLFCAHYERTDAWPVRAMALLALGSHWHPSACPTVADALDDDELRPFALELLRGTRVDVLRHVVGHEALGDELVKLARNRNDLIRERALGILRDVAGRDAEVDSDRDFARWRREAEKAGTFPGAWPEIPAEEPGARDAKRATRAVPSDRAVDLRESGLDMVVVIDTTSSMQRAVDAAVAALEDVIELLRAVAPRFRVGIVEYRDFGDMKDGAGVVQDLTRSQRKAKDALGKIRVAGGGDVPERIEKGIELALSHEMGWDPRANKLILVVGDAPAHADAVAPMLATVAEAYEKPESTGRGRGRYRTPTTGRRDPVPPFVTSAIAAHPGASPHMQKIADAGRGTFATLAVQSAATAGRDIARHMLVDAFGAVWRDSVVEMLDVWFEYKDADAFGR